MNITIGEGFLYSGLGMVIVFFGLICLMIVINLMAKLVRKNAQAPAAAAPAAAPAAMSAPAAAAPAVKAVRQDTAAAPGSAGEIKLCNVSDRDAAMIMAITANAMGKPLNEIRFKSIREVK